MKDKAGKVLPEDEVRDLAERNIRGSLSRNELIEAYMIGLSDAELIEWAADENGEFPND